MPWTRPSLQTLYSRIKSDFSAHLLDGANPAAASVVSVLSRVWAGACHLMHGFLSSYIFKNAIPDTAEDDYLRRWSAIWDVFPNGAETARGPVQVNGSPGALVKSGEYLFNQASALRYKTLAEVNLDSNGQAELEVEAIGSGPDYNLDAGVALRFVSAAPGVKQEGVVAGPGITGGVEEEDLESLRGRMLEKIREPPHGGAAHDYAAWAKSVSGITRAWVYPNHFGLGSVGVCVLNDDREGPEAPLPDSETLARCNEYIQEVKPVTAFAVAFAPDVEEFTVQVRLSPDSEVVREAVHREVSDLWSREAEPGGKIPLTHIAEAVSLAAGEYDHELVSPSANVETAAGVYPKLAGVEFLGPLEA